MNKEQDSILKLLKHDDKTFVIQGLELATSIAPTPLALQKLLTLPKGPTPKSLFKHFEDFPHAGFIAVWITDLFEKHGIKLERHYLFVFKSRKVECSLQEISKEAYLFWHHKEMNDLINHVLSKSNDDVTLPVPEFAVIAKENIEFFYQESISYFSSNDLIYITEWLLPDEVPLHPYFQARFKDLENTGGSGRESKKINFSIPPIKNTIAPTLESPAEPYFVFREKEYHQEQRLNLSILGKLDFSRLHISVEFDAIVGRKLSGIQYDDVHQGMIDIYLGEMDGHIIFDGCFLTRQKQFFHIKPESLESK